MDDRPQSVTARRMLLTVFVVAVTFWIYSFCHAPIPGANEPHYLCKAKHFWQPDWCERDFFLTSSNPHLMFYVVTGWLAPWLSFGALAVLARGVGYLWLAIGWTRFGAACGLISQGTVVGAWLLLTLNSLVSLSGEWMVGGIESKVLAYACVLSACADMMQRRWKLAGLHAGLAVAFHPLVGLWSVTAGTFAVLVNWWLSVPRSPIARPNRSQLVGTGLFVMTAACGVIPALSAVAGASARDNFAANFIQVFHRLSHHLDPMQFPLRNYLIYAGLFACGLWMQRRLAATSERTWLRNFALGAVLIAVAGWIAGVGHRPHPEHMPLFELRMTLLKFYPFRLADAVVPIFFVVAIVSTFRERRPLAWGSAVLFLLTLASGWGAGSARYLPGDRERDWLATCDWIKANTPKDALFITPRESWGFKWFADRAEYVASKDCPQDPKSLVEWNSRLRWLQHWSENSFADERYDDREIRALQAHTQAEFFISRELAKLEAPVVYENSTYTIYRVADPSITRSH
jgi:hypothetical protein